MRKAIGLFFIVCILMSSSCAPKSDNVEMKFPPPSSKTPEIRISATVPASTTSLLSEPTKTTDSGAYTSPTPEPSKIEATQIVTKSPSIKSYNGVPAAIQMVQIRAGEFLMGSPEGEGNDDEHPQHKVYLDTYYIGKYEVTNEQFSKFVSSTNYKTEAPWKAYADSGKEKHPVGAVSWNDAMAYCRWAGGSLPTEAQWEKAARGTDGRTYPWGNSWDASRCNNGLTAVGSYSTGASPYGVHDMAGNAWEWCADFYDENYYRSSPSRNPKGAGGRLYRVLRSGWWGAEDPVYFRCAIRKPRQPGNWGEPAIGFRVCRSSTTP